MEGLMAEVFTLVVGMLIKASVAQNKLFGPNSKTNLELNRLSAQFGLRKFLFDAATNADAKI